jgi:anti-sigma factor RsiW
MAANHLTSDDMEQYVEKQMGDRARAAMDEHLAACAICGARVARGQKLDAALHALPRARAPQDLAARISAAVEWRMEQERARRARMPLIAVALSFSLLLAVWFGLEMIIAFQDNGVLDFLAVFTSHSEFSYSPDTLMALIEALPLSEVGLMLFALVTALVLAQQLVDTIRPNAMQFRR